MPDVRLLLLINLTLSALLTGLIWIIQVVHYPGFLRVGAENFLAYQHGHMRTISYVVVPLMLGELAAALWLLFILPWPSWLAYVASGMVVLIWLDTFLVFVPLHNKLLEEGYNVLLIRRLILANWVRTVAWSVRTLVLFHLMTLFIRE